ncbi:MAG TPA: hypothetical protein VF137_11205 [Candidatus Dormibacteraeota bacterium]
MSLALGPLSRLRLPSLVLGAVLALSFIVTPTQPSSAPEARLLSASSVQVGTSFSPWRAENLGLDYRAAFAELLAMHFRVIRVAVRWDQVEASGYDQPDLLLRMAEAAHQPVVLEVGMKSLGWPEFYLPPGLPSTPDGGDVGASHAVRAEVVAYVRQTVLRYRASPSLVAWQVENEPFNPAGPHHWYIDQETVKAEMNAVRALDPRPLEVNAFTHFNLLLDRASTGGGLSPASFLGFDAPYAETEALGVEHRGDVLGLDVYTHIGYDVLGQRGVTTADPDWAESAGRWAAKARDQRKLAWVMEAQAEPWEASPSTNAHPQSLRPTDIKANVDALKAAGFNTVVLWGSEYWLSREQAGDPTWVRAVDQVLTEQRAAPALTRGHGL